MARFSLPRIRVPQLELIAWAALTLLLVVGVSSTLVDFFQLPTTLAHLANEQGQRAVIDPQTGAVSLGASTGKEAYEVGEEPHDTPSDAPANNEPQPEPVATETEHPAPTEPAASTEDDNASLSPLRTEPLPGTLDGAEKDSRLVRAPAPEITEKLGGAALPKRGAGDRTASIIYARPFTRTPEQHLFAVVLLDAGLSTQSLPLILGLPKDVTVAFSPYARDSNAVIETLRSAGYETWEMLPVAGERYPQDDPGPLGLTGSIPKDETVRRLNETMANAVGSAGMVLPPDEGLSKKPDLFGLVLSEVTNRGLNVLSTHPNRGIEQLTRDKKLQDMLRRADIILDPVADEAQITSKLASLKETLANKDEVIVVASARPQTLTLLARWFKENPPAEPVALAPLSAFWKPKEAPPPPEAKEEKPGHGEKKDEKKPDEKKSGGH